MSSENRFFEEVKGRLENYTPEAPAEVFGMARNQFLTRRFFRFNVQHFNIWYVGVLVSGITAAVVLSNDHTAAEVVVTAPQEIQAAPIVQPSTPAEVVTPATETPKEKPTVVKRKSPAVTKESNELAPVEATVVEEKVMVEETPEPTSNAAPNTKSLNVKVLKDKK